MRHHAADQFGNFGVFLLKQTHDEGAQAGARPPRQTLHLHEHVNAIFRLDQLLQQGLDIFSHVGPMHVASVGPVVA